MAFIILWTVSGLYLDGWSHIANKPETFFTPWHGLLYSGFLAGVVWSVREGRREGSLAIDDRLSTAGVVIFGTGMVTDFIWHEVFGIEVDLEALVSPTHLLLMTGGLLLASGPFRSALTATDETDRPAWRDFIAPLISVAATAAVAAFFLMYLSAFQGDTASEAVRYIRPDGVVPDDAIARGMGAVLVTTLVLVVPVAFILRRWRPPTGSLLAFCSMIGLAQVALEGFDRAAIGLGAVAAGLGAEAAVGLRRPQFAGAAMALLAWPVWFAALEATGTMTWNATLMCGATVMAILLGGLVQLLHPPVAGSPAWLPTSRSVTSAKTTSKHSPTRTGVNA